MKIKILGSGSADGIPSITNFWKDNLDKNNIKNIRFRSSFYLNDNKNLLVECGPDIREQTIKHNLKDFNSIFISHGHMDHIAGIWELEQIIYLYKKQLTIYVNQQTTDIIKEKFPWIFDNDYITIKTINSLEKQNIDGFEIMPMNFKHGKRMISMGFRYKNFAFTPDLHEIPQENDEYLKNLDLWLLECNDLEYNEKFGHTYLQQALEFINKYKPKRAILNHLSDAIDYETISKKLPKNVELAYDGMKIEV